MVAIEHSYGIVEMISVPDLRGRALYWLSYTFNVRNDPRQAQRPIGYNCINRCISLVYAVWLL